MNKKNIKQKTTVFELKYFEVIRQNRVNKSISWGDPCTHGGDDLVWCKEGDSCGEADNMCTSLCPWAACRHDGCCTGWWDWGSDDEGEEDLIASIFYSNSHSNK